MGTHRFALVVILLTACGDDTGSTRADAAGDTTGDVPCSYTESADAQNTMLADAEATSLTVGATPLVICGAIDNGHFDGSLEVVDGDFYRFTVAAPTDLIIHVTGSGVSMPKQVLMQVNQMGSFSFFGFGTVVGDHGSLVSHIATAGDYTIAVGAVNPQDLSSAVNYKISIAVDAPATRCPASTGAVSHAEGTDGGANDVFEYASAGNPNSTLTSTTSDAPEATGITAAAATSYLITGTEDNVNLPDDYMGRDTFAFTTGASTNQMSIRLNWPSTTADLDFRVYPMAIARPLSIVGGLDASNMQDEFETFAVKPNTQYLLWVAASDGSTAPATYSATLCGETFSP